MTTYYNSKIWYLIRSNVGYFDDYIPPVVMKERKKKKKKPIKKHAEWRRLLDYFLTVSRRRRGLTALHKY
jgi:hypothetical protein